MTASGCLGLCQCVSLCMSVCPGWSVWFSNGVSECRCVCAGVYLCGRVPLYGWVGRWEIVAG